MLDKLRALLEKVKFRSSCCNGVVIDVQEGGHVHVKKDDTHFELDIIPENVENTEHNRKAIVLAELEAKRKDETKE